ncbi:MAG: hypothetical protein H7222_07435 [Methylotenera sp.]|nr:hypothetical protein [Oligoflexia bacterium]
MKTSLCTILALLSLTASAADPAQLVSDSESAMATSVYAAACALKHSPSPALMIGFGSNEDSAKRDALRGPISVGISMDFYKCILKIVEPESSNYAAVCSLKNSNDSELMIGFGMNEDAAKRDALKGPISIGISMDFYDCTLQVRNP